MLAACAFCFLGAPGPAGGATSTRHWAALLEDVTAAADLPQGSPPLSLLALRTQGLPLADVRAMAGSDPHGLVRRVQEHASAVGAWALRCAQCVLGCVVVSMLMVGYAPHLHKRCPHP